MRQSLARAAPAALASVASTSSAPATALRPATQQQQALLPARRVARKIAAVRNQEQQRRGPRPLQASTTNFRFPKLSMPGIDGALSSITSDIDAAESDGTLIDVTIRDVKVSFFLLFFWEGETLRGAGEPPLPLSTLRRQVAHGDPKNRVARSTSALYRWLPESVMSAPAAVRDRGSKQR